MSPDSPEDRQPLTPGQKKSRARPKWGNGFEAKVGLIASMIVPFDFFVPIGALFLGAGWVFFPMFLVSLVLLGLPMLLLEVAVGQFMGRGTWAAWNIAPLFKGIGYLTTLLNGNGAMLVFWLLMSQVIFCHDLAVSEPHEVSMFSHCPNNLTFGDVYNDTSKNVSGPPTPSFCEPRPVYSDRWIHPFTEDEAELLTGKQLDGGQVLAMLLLILLVCGIVAAGRRVLGVFSAVCAILPPVLLLMLTIRVVTLPGASEALRYVFTPIWWRVRHVDLIPGVFATTMFVHAALFPMLLVGAGEGRTLTAASYNRFHNGFLLDCLLAVFVRTVTVILTALTVYGAVGVAAHVRGTSFEMMVLSGFELIHLVSETLLLETPGGGFWTACFLICILLSCLSYAVWTAESAVAAIWDILPQTPRFRHLLKKPVLVAVFAVPWLLYGIGWCTKGTLRLAARESKWMYGHFTLVPLCLLECIAIGWLFGARRFQAGWAAMQGRCAFPYPMVFWAVVTPVALVALLVMMWIGRMDFLWQQSVGYFVGTLLFVVIPATVLLFTRPGTLRQKWKIMTTPWDLEPHQTQSSYGRYETIPMSAMAG